MNPVYYIGGSPCSGKSTIAEMLVEKYNFKYFKQDDYLEEYFNRGIQEGNDLFKRVASFSKDEMWLRQPDQLRDEEIALYQAMFRYFLNDLSHLLGDKPIIAEGAGFMPRLLKGEGVDKQSFCGMIPTKEFQVKMYSKREWVAEYLSDCSKPDEAFKNWMERDFLFGIKVYQEAVDLGYECVVVDGRKSIAEIGAAVEKIFRLDNHAIR